VMKRAVRILVPLLLLASTFGATAPMAPNSALKWKATKIQIAVSSSLTRENSAIKAGSDVEGAIRRSLKTWEKVANIEFVETSTDRQNVSPSGAAGDGTSLITIAPSAENVLLFSKDPDQVAATTRLFYSGRGFITEADIVLNPYQQFSTDGTFGTYDLESTITHEIGHLLGLEHSTVIGSTMHESFGKNGVYGLQHFAARSLSASDIAAVRAIYGSRGNVECCGQVSGKLLFSSGKFVKAAEVWLEDAVTGDVETKTLSTIDGTFRFEGIATGSYKVFAQDARQLKSTFPAQQIGEVSVEKGETNASTRRISLSPRNLELSYLGFNGQLSDVAVSLNAGRTYTIYIGGKNLDPKAISISFNSPYITVVPNTLRSQDYDRVSAVSFEVRIDPRAPNGSYSIFAETRDGDRSSLVGALSIDSFSNPFSTFILSEE
jgi:hypothetical protein